MSRRSAIILIAVVLVGLVALVVAGYLALRSAADSFLLGMTQTLDEAEVAAFIGAPFPESATGVATAGESALDTIVVARFEAPLPDVLAYLDGLGLTGPLQPGYSPFFSSESLIKGTEAWWSPPAVGDTTGNFSGLYQQSGPKYYNIVVVDSGGGRATVYMQVFNT